MIYNRADAEKEFMGDGYKPPFTMTEDITNLVIEIGEFVGRITAHDELSINPRIRRENRIKTIYSSLAIEQNTMSLEQVSDVLDGKRVLAPPQDIREVKNAYESYEELQRMNPYSIKDLLKAHKFMMNGLVSEAGTFRSKGVGVYAGEQLIHAGTPPQYVPVISALPAVLGRILHTSTHLLFCNRLYLIHPFYSQI